ncbi:hypothetical protein F1654_06435 [Alkalicaulis satelles]|uniref:Uncharacterized protein n=1 Tax=Alkalicaulis satelles TaxID=2609175 RepID=A0A5M6ZGK9_9PROT|nr:CopG family antitoxin [Alkalicaulis satelles]KAA5803440.1 hypothetical protein F1654_06435 [Alkalicaulis satelles]
MSKKPETVPVFASEAEERAWRESHDSADYVDWSKAEPVRIANLKPGAASIPAPQKRALGADKIERS